MYVSSQIQIFLVDQLSPWKNHFDSERKKKKKSFPVSQILSRLFQRSLCCRVPSSGTPVCRSWWSGVECVERRGGKASLKKKIERAGVERGCSIVPTQSIHPLLICRSLVLFRWGD